MSNTKNKEKTMECIISKKFTTPQLEEMIALRKQERTFEDISAYLEKKHKIEMGPENVRYWVNKYFNYFDGDASQIDVNILKQSAITKYRSSKVAKENKLIIEQLAKEQDLFEHIESLVAKLNIKAPKFIPAIKDKAKRNMNIELLLSDIHYGKKTESFNLEICRNRIKFLTDVFIKEIKEKQKTFNVERLIIALLGDIIESSTMHGIESRKGSEFGNSRQVQEAINSLFMDVVVPVAALNIPIIVPAVTGNHDRTEIGRTYHNPGEENLTYIIYKTLEMLCIQAGYKHIKFQIPIESFTTIDIYGNTSLFEHYDNSKANSRKALEGLMMKRQNQVKKVLSFMRGGHFHEYTVFGRGTIITNGSVPGQDSYANVLGFDSEANQTINYYVETKTRPTCYYASFPVYLP